MLLLLRMSLESVVVVSMQLLFLGLWWFPVVAEQLRVDASLCHVHLPFPLRHLVCLSGSSCLECSPTRCAHLLPAD